MISNTYSVTLNFLALEIQEFTFTVYRKQCDEKEKKARVDLYRGSLPIQAGIDISQQEARSEYWISLTPSSGFEPFECQPSYNHSLTKYVLYKALESRLTHLETALQYEISSSKFEKTIFFKLQEHQEGYEVIYLEPYYLSVAKKFGFLIDFEFHKRDDVPFNRSVQRLSLSLDENFKSNRNFYLDKYKKIKNFIISALTHHQIFPVQGNFHQNIDVERSLLQVEVETLSPKTYIFGNDQEGQTLFNGISKFGPLKRLEESVEFYFTFTDETRDFAVDLYKALCGKLSATTFAGMREVFGTIIEKENTKRSCLKTFTNENIQQLVNEIKTTPRRKAIQIAILLSKDTKKEYLDLKYHFLQENIPLQIVTLDLLKNKQAFKWSVSNIGLQIFAKLGGKPWKVKPSNQNCLIIGVGQAHKLTRTAEGRTDVDKYFAYSVLMDSSGIYKDIEVLGNTEDEDSYMHQMQLKIEEIIRRYCGEFKKFVIHTPFRLKNKELETIKNSLQKLSSSEDLKELEFLVIKINTNNKFFGYYSDSNSLVPYESTCLQLSSNEYLIWFEGIQRNKPNVYKRFSGPTHIQFYYSSKHLSPPEKMKYLQDVINLSGANWRGFNAKSLPVSIYYCQLIARRIKEFDSLGYEDIQIKDSNPWFL